MKDPQKQRIKDLEKELADAKLKLLAYEKLVTIAEQEKGVSKNEILPHKKMISKKEKLLAGYSINN